MLSNVDWDLKPNTKHSLEKFANDDRLILHIDANWEPYHSDNKPKCDIIRIPTMLKKCDSESIYILDDDDALMRNLEEVPKDYDGVIYDAQWGKERLTGFNFNRPGVAFGYARCILKREWVKQTHQIALDAGIKCMFDVFVFYNLAINGRCLVKEELLCDIDITPRTMNGNNYRSLYQKELKIMRDYFDLPNR